MSGCPWSTDWTRSVFHDRKCPFCASQIDFHRCGWTIQVATLWFISQHMEKFLLPQVRSGMIIPTTQGNPQYHEMMGFSKSIMCSNFFVASAASPEAVSSSKAATGDHCRHRGVFGIRWSQVRNRSKKARFGKLTFKNSIMSMVCPLPMLVCQQISTLYYSDFSARIRDHLIKHFEPFRHFLLLDLNNFSEIYTLGRPIF